MLIKLINCEIFFIQNHNLWTLSSNVVDSYGDGLRNSGYAWELERRATQPWVHGCKWSLAVVGSAMAVMCGDWQ